MSDEAYLKINMYSYASFTQLIQDLTTHEGASVVFPL